MRTREDAQQQVEGLADRPRVGVGPEVAGALALGAAHHLGARELLTERHREVGVGLVVAVLDVEPRVVLLDPRVLELERLDLGGDHGPLDARGGGDHRGRPGVQRGDVLEVGGQPRAQRLGLADVDDPLGRVPEPVDARVDGDLPRRRAVGRRVSHDSTLWRVTDGAPARDAGVCRVVTTRHTSPCGSRSRRGQVTVIPSPLTVTVFSGRALVAGPCFTAPVAMSYWLPWQAQLIVPSATLAHHAVLVGAHGAERLEVTGRGLGDDDLLVGEDLAPADGDGGLGDGLLDRVGGTEPAASLAASSAPPQAARAVDADPGEADGGQHGAAGGPPVVGWSCGVVMRAPFGGGAPCRGD